MSYVHRAALTITRKQPYIDWANRPVEDGDEQVAYPEDDPRTVYLVPTGGYDVALEELLDEFWQDIFEEELAMWSEDETTWPEPTRAGFDEWFGVELTDSVFDLAPDEPLSQTDVELADISYTLQHCAWCDVELDPQDGRGVGFKVADRELFAGREGLVLSLPLDEERAVAGIFTAADSEAALAGDDFVFRACTSRCEKALRKAVPRALRRLPV
jgi:hypothetical protein